MEEYLAQFQIIIGAIELNETERRDFNNIVRSLNTRYGSVERDEIFRARLLTRVRDKEESIPALAKAIKLYLTCFYETYFETN